MANTSTILILILFGILSMFAALPLMASSDPRANALNKTAGQLDQSLNSFQNSVESFSSSNNIGVLLVNGVVVAGGAFDVVKNVFVAIPTTVVNALDVPVVGQFIGTVLVFLIAMGAVAFFLGRGGNM